MIQIIQLWVLCSRLHRVTCFCAIHLTYQLPHVYIQIFVGGLDSNVTDETLRQVFSQFGELIHVKIPVGKRCGFVQFANRYANFLEFRAICIIEIPQPLNTLKCLVHARQSLCRGGFTDVEWNSVGGASHTAFLGPQSFKQAGELSSLYYSFHICLLPLCYSFLKLIILTGLGGFSLSRIQINGMVVTMGDMGKAMKPMGMLHLLRILTCMLMERILDTRTISNSR